MRRRHCVGSRSDRGGGSVEYIAILLLLATLVGILVTSAVPGVIAGDINAAICRVFGGTDCKVAPQAADPYEPQQDCWTWMRDATIEGTLNVQVRYVTIRGQHRVTVTTRRVQHPDGTISYDVIVSPNWEVGVATPTANSGQMGGADSEGGASKNRRFDFGAWAALQGTVGKIYTFNASDNGGDEAKTRDQAMTFADKLWVNQAQDDALNTTAATVPPLGALYSIPGVKDGIKKGWNWLIGKSAPVTKHLPVVGDNIERATQAPDRDVNRPDQDFIEGGPTAGFNGSVQIFPGKLGISTAGRGFMNLGVRINHTSDKYNKNYYFKMNGEAEVAPTLDLGSWVPKGQKFDGFISGVEKALSKTARTKVVIPPAVRKALLADWPDVAFNVKGKATRMYMLTTDKQNNPTQLRTITETQYVFSVAGKSTGTKKGKEGTAFAQTSIGGRKYNTQTILDLDGPEHAENLQKTKEFLGGTGLDALTNPGKGITDFFGLSPEAVAFDDYEKRNGQTYQQIWDSDVTTYVGAANAGVVGGYLLYEPETNKLTDAQYYNPDKGWLPWTVCKVGG
jgi:hypothetical protein